MEGLLLVVVQGNGKVLPVLIVDGHRVERLSTAVEDLKVVLVTSGLADDLSSLELDFVGRVIGSLMPHVL